MRLKSSENMRANKKTRSNGDLYKLFFFVGEK